MCSKAFFIVFSAFFTTLLTANAQDLLVPGDFPSIQEAIEAAETGDRVLVSPGIYNEQIDFLGKSIQVVGELGPEVTTINGGGVDGYVVSIVAGNPTQTRLIGFTVTGGNSPSFSIPGGGLWISGGGATIQNCIFTGNHGSIGGGLSIFEGVVEINNTQVSQNSALQGGGLYCEFAELTIRDSQFTGNSAIQFGGAAAINWLSELDCKNCLFQGNSANSFGGAIYANLAVIQADQLTIADNGEVEQFESSFSVKPLGGGGIYTTSTSGRVSASRIVRNNAGFGTGVYVAQSGTLEFVNTLIADNGAEIAAGQGAVYCNSASPVLINCTIAGNGGFSSVFTTFNSFPAVRNSILGGLVNGIDAQSPTAGNGNTKLDFCLVQGQPFAATEGGGNIVVTDLPGLDAAADYALLPGSPAIDAGNNSFVPSDITTDLLGNQRFFDDPDTPNSGVGNGPIVDLGAIEFGSSPPQSPSNMFDKHRPIRPQPKGKR